MFDTNLLPDCLVCYELASTCKGFDIIESESGKTAMLLVLKHQALRMDDDQECI